MIDFQKLDYKDFEILVGLVLKREGHSIIHGPPATGKTGLDYETRAPQGYPVLVDVKHFKKSVVTRSGLAQFAHDIERYRQQKPDARGLLIFSSELKTITISEFTAEFPHIDVWDRRVVMSLIQKHSDLEPVFNALIGAKDSFQSQVEQLLSDVRPSVELIAKLSALPCGKNDWREFERICTEILTYVFTPDLATPDIQSRSDDGLDIIDAIFPIRSYQHPWSLIRSEYGTRFVVAEFKNYCDPIGQQQVESIAQYLWKPAQRFFGILVSRLQPSQNALAQRRRKWLDEGKCIIFLDEESLVEMLNLRDSSGDPFDIIDAQLEDFFRTLTP
jgi:hypothetical protein